MGIFAATLMGAGLFAWLYVEWDHDLWVPMGLHFAMSLSGDLFTISDNALGSLSANLIRGLTVALAIIGTVKYKKRTGLPLTVTRATLMHSRPG